MYPAHIYFIAFLKENIQDSLSYKSKRVWFIGMTKLAKICYTVDSGSYNNYETVIPPLDHAPLASGVSLLETGNSEIDKDENEYYKSKETARKQPLPNKKRFSPKKFKNKMDNITQ